MFTPHLIMVKCFTALTRDQRHQRDPLTLVCWPIWPMTHWLLCQPDKGTEHPLIAPIATMYFLHEGEYYSIKIQRILWYFRAPIICSCSTWCDQKLGRKLGKQGYEMFPLLSILNALLSWLSEQTVCRVFWTNMCVEYKESHNDEIISSAEKVVRP